MSKFESGNILISNANGVIVRVLGHDGYDMRAKVIDSGESTCELEVVGAIHDNFNMSVSNWSLIKEASPLWKVLNGETT